MTTSLTGRLEMCSVCIVRVQPGKRAVDDADYTAVTLQHDLLMGHADPDLH